MSGATARDTSGYFPELNLSLPDSAGLEWVESGLRISAPTLLTSATPASKLADAVKLTDEISLEAWIQPADIVQAGPARFFSVSVDGSQRNLLLGQDGSRYLARLRTSETDVNGLPDLQSEEVATTSLSHVVYTRAEDGSEFLYLNGDEIASGVRAGTLSNWNADYHLGVAHEFGGGERDWQGTIFLIAVYDRALSESEVVTNSLAGH